MENREETESMKINSFQESNVINSQALSGVLCSVSGWSKTELLIENDATTVPFQSICQYGGGTLANSFLNILNI